MTCLHENLVVRACGPAPDWKVQMIKCVDCRSWWRAQLVYDGERAVYY